MRYSDVPAYGRLLLRQRIHLKKVIVTSAVCQSLASLKRSLRYWYWADVTGYTRPYGLAASYVFVKQSGLLGHCALQSHDKRTRAGTPSTEVTEPFCRVPSTRLLPSHLRLLTQGHQCWFLVRISLIFPNSFFTVSRYLRNTP